MSCPATLTCSVLLLHAALRPFRVRKRVSDPHSFLMHPAQVTPASSLLPLLPSLVPPCVWLKQVSRAPPVRRLFWGYRGVQPLAALSGQANLVRLIRDSQLAQLRDNVRGGEPCQAA
jgi:hypothetical protein